MFSFNKAMLGAAIAASLFATVPAAEAMPIAPVAHAATMDGVQEARLVCGPYRCFRRFGYRPFRRFGFGYSYGRFHRGYGFRHRFGHRRFL